MKRPMFLAGIVLAMAMSFTACGGSKEEQTQQPVAQQEDVKSENESTEVSEKESEVDAENGAVTPALLIEEVENAVDSSIYPFTSENEVTSKRRVLGVNVREMESYAAYCKTTSGDAQEEYILFVGKANSDTAAEDAKGALEEYIANESESMKNYLSDEGKKLFPNAKCGTKDSWVWAVMIGSADDNQSVIDAIMQKM